MKSVAAQRQEITNGHIRNLIAHSEALEATIAVLEKAAEPMISVDDQLPEHEKEVVVLGLWRSSTDVSDAWEPAYTIGRYEIGNFWDTQLHYDLHGEFCCVMYWKELPEMPEIDVKAALQKRLDELQELRDEEEFG